MRMTKVQRTYARNNKIRTKKIIMFNMLVCCIIIFIAFIQSKVANGKDLTKQVNQPSTYQIITSNDSNNLNDDKPKKSKYPRCKYSKDWNKNESYLLAKIAMCEAEGCNIKAKEYVIYVVLNRVSSKEFPDTIKEVIYQNYNGVYQFTPIGDGRWDKVEPNDESWDALRNVMTNLYDPSEGALYFESCANSDNWHSRNLTYLYTRDGIRFYK